jgi:ATP-dependent exoDNAse (exonuclease V) beta subunit
VSSWGVAEGELAVRNIDRILDLGERIKPHSSSGYFEFINRLRTIATSDDLGIAHTNKDALSLMTIHKSKGLEYPVVIILGTSDDWHSEDEAFVKVTNAAGRSHIYYIGSKSEGCRPVDDPEFDKLLATSKEQSLVESHRLLYVALTRARHHLLITSRKSKATSKDGFHAHLKQALVELGGIDSEIFNHQATVIHRRAASLPLALESTVKDRQQIPTTGGTSNHKDLRFYTPHAEHDDADTSAVKKIESTKFDQRLMGIAIHKALEQLVQTKSYDAKSILSWLHFEENFSSDDDQDYLRHLNNTMDFVLKSKTWTHILQSSKLHSEKPFVYRDGSKIISGTFDLLCERGKNLWVVDFKNPALATPKTSLTELARELGYAGQMSMYKRAAKSLFPDKSVESFVWILPYDELVSI